MFRMLMCICELIGEFEFDGLSPKPPNKNHRQYFHVYTISFKYVCQVSIRLLDSVLDVYNCLVALNFASGCYATTNILILGGSAKSERPANHTISIFYNTPTSAISDL